MQVPHFKIRVCGSNLVRRVVPHPSHAIDLNIAEALPTMNAVCHACSVLHKLEVKQTETLAWRPL